MKLHTICSLALATFLGLSVFVPTACSGGDSYNPGPDTASYTSLSDTLSQLLGEVNGYNVLDRLNQYRQLVDSTYDTAEFAEGLVVALDARYPSEYNSGLMLGFQMGRDMDSLIEADRGLSRERILTSIEKYVNDGFVPITAFADRSDEILKRYTMSASGDARTALADSLMDSYSQFIGTLALGEIQRTRETADRPIDKKAFLGGVRRAFSGPHSTEFVAGSVYAIDIAEGIADIEKKGVNIRRDKVLETMRKILADGNYDAPAALKSREMLQSRMTAINQRAYDAEEAAMATSKEAEANILNGKLAANEVITEEPGALTTPSGIVYLQHREGKGDLPTENDTVTLKYTGSHADGKVFDIQARMRVRVGDMVPGMKEALMLMRPGGKSSFWIPGELAYKGHGVPAFGIGPMEMIVLHLEMLDVAKGSGATSEATAGK